MSLCRRQNGQTNIHFYILDLLYLYIFQIRHKLIGIIFKLVLFNSLKSMIVLPIFQNSIKFENGILYFSCNLIIYISSPIYCPLL